MGSGAFGNVTINGGGSSTWGAITGVLSDQTDLENALNAKQDTLVSATNIKTVNGTSLLGSGDLPISTSANWGSIGGTLSSQTDLQTALNAKKTDSVSSTSKLLGRFSVGSGTIEEISLGSGLSLSGLGVLSSIGGSGIVNGANGATLFCLENGSYATLQDVINVAAAIGTNCTIIVGAKTNGASWGNITIPDQKQINIVGLQSPQGLNVQIGTVTMSPTTGANINVNQCHLSNLYINSSSATVITFGGTAPARLRIYDCYINSTNAAPQLINATNSGSGSSLYLIRTRLDGNLTGTLPALQTSLYTRVFSSEIGCGAYGVQVNAGTTELNDSIISYTNARSTIEVANGAVLLAGAGTLISNTTTNATGINFNGASAVAGLFGVTFAIGTGTGKVLNGTGVVGFSTVNFSNSVLQAYNTSISGTITKAAYTLMA